MNTAELVTLRILFEFHHIANDVISEIAFYGKHNLFSRIYIYIYIYVCVCVCVCVSVKLLHCILVAKFEVENEMVAKASRDSILMALTIHLLC